MEPQEYELMDAAEGRMWWYRALHVRLLDTLAGVRGRVLDAGCGTGGLLARLARSRPDLQAVGVEYSPDALRRARRKSSARLVGGSVNALPFAAGAFDAVVAADVLCHAAVAPAPALAELYRVLRPGGLLVANMPAYRWLLSTHDRRVHNARRWSRGAFREALAEAGFGAIRVRYWNGLLLPLMVLERKVLARGETAGSDVAPFSPWLDAAFHGITRLERHLPFQLPAGGSVLASAIRPVGS